MRNEQRFIAHCLQSVLGQDYPVDRFEIRVMDGQSTDRSWSIAAELLRGRPNAHLVTNPGVTQAAGWNLGISQATGDVIGIASAHVVLAPDYVSQAVETLRRTGADLVGGPIRASGSSPAGQAIAAATSSRFGVGGARFHYLDKEEDVDTVYMGLCKRETFARIGSFDLEMVHNQDDELSYRLLDAGGRIVCNPAIRSEYFNRATIRSLWMQYFQYGYWKVRVAQKHRRQMRLRHFASAGLVTGLAAAALVGWVPGVGGGPLAALCLSYVAANLTASVLTSARRGWSLLPLLPVVFATLHFSYGAGFIAGCLNAFAVGSRGGRPRRAS